MGEDPYVPSKALFQLEKLGQLRNNISFAPTLLQVDPESFCNHNCSFCSYRQENMHNTQMLELIDGKTHTENKPIGIPSSKSGWPIEMSTKLPIMMKEAGIPAIEITGGGESTLWRGFDDLVKNCFNNSIEVGIVTNGSQLNPERCKLLARCTWIRISLDASNEDIHQNIHRTATKEFHRIINSIIDLVNQKKEQKTDVTIGISCIIQQENYEYIEDMILVCKKLGVDNLRFSFMYDKTGKAGLTDEQHEQLLPILEKYKLLHDTESFKILFDTSRLWMYSKPNNDFKKCHIQKFVWAIGADLKVYPCCIVKYDPKMALADLHTQTLKEIIDDANFKIKQDGINVSLCPPCWLRERNKAIEQTQLKPKHSNFL